MVELKKLKIKGKKQKKNEGFLDRSKFKFKKGKENPFVSILEDTWQYDRLDK